MEANILIPVNDGRAHLRVKFEGGIPTEEDEMPAKYTTSSEMEQRIIEESPLFGRVIFRYDEMGNKMEATPKPGAPFRKVGKSYPEIETMAEVTDKILELGATAADVVSESAVLAFCKKNGLSFPNLKFDNTPDNKKKKA